MRTTRLAGATGLAVALLLAGGLAGCGDGSGSAGDATASDSSASVSPGADPSMLTPTAEPVSVRKTCEELYHPPGQVMQHAIAFVHGSPSQADASSAAALVDSLAAVEGHSLGPLAEDIAVVRTAVEAQGQAATSGSAGPVVKDFDSAANRLARHCELYSD
jgi:hypothetical protein